MLRINNFVFFLKCQKLVISLSNLLTHWFPRYETFHDIVKLEDFEG